MPWPSPPPRAPGYPSTHKRRGATPLDPRGAPKTPGAPVLRQGGRPPWTLAARKTRGRASSLGKDGPPCRMNRIGKTAQVAEWWRTAAVYQIYPRSFADSGGDGIGDLPGITSRIPYLKELGVDAVWLSPFYPSALADGGYDVDDYRDIDPRLGTLDDFDAMVTGLHDAGSEGDRRHRAQPQLQPASRGSSKHSPPARARPNAIATSSATDPARTAPSLPTTGNRCSAGPPGSLSETDSSTSTASPPSSPTSTGRAKRSGPTSAPPCGSGPIVAWTASGSTWRTGCARTCRSRMRRGARSRR